MNAKRVIWVLLAIAVVAATSSPATADGPYPYYYGAYYGDLAPWAHAATQVGQHTGVPYYALYPPVYYSHPVKRTYGRSPLAYLPGYFGFDPAAALGDAPSAYGSGRRAASPTPVRPVTVKNPYVADGAGVAPDTQQASRGPLRLINPYVEASGDSPAVLAVAEHRRPQVVFPTAMARQRN